MHKDIVKEVVDALIIQHMGDNLEKAVIDGLDDD